MLNNFEKAVLKAVIFHIAECTGCEFGYTDEIKVKGMTDHQVAGYMSQLSQKDYIVIWDEFHQVTLNSKCEKIFPRMVEGFEFTNN